MSHKANQDTPSHHVYVTQGNILPYPLPTPLSALGYVINILCPLVTGNTFNTFIL